MRNSGSYISYLAVVNIDPCCPQTFVDTIINVTLSPLCSILCVQAARQIGIIQCIPDLHYKASLLPL